MRLPSNVKPSLNVPVAQTAASRDFEQSGVLANITEADRVNA